MTIEEKLNFIDRDLDNYLAACRAKYGEMPDTVDELREYVEKFTSTPDAKEWIGKYDAHGDKPRNSCFDYVTVSFAYKFLDPVSNKMLAIEKLNRLNENTRSKFSAYREEYIKQNE